MVARTITFRSLLGWPHWLIGSYRCTCACRCPIFKSYPGSCCMCRHDLHETPAATSIPRPEVTHARA